MASYTDPTKMAAYLGVPFTVNQTPVAQAAADAVTAQIDRRTGRSWQHVGSAVVDEIQPITSGLAFVAYPPVLALGDVEQRQRGNSNDWTLLDPSEYALTDPEEGRIEFFSQTLAPNYDARIDYTSAVTAPPDDILLAATVLACYWMTSSLRPGTAGLSSLAVGQNDIALQFASGANSPLGNDLTVALRIVDGYRKVVLA